VPQGEFSSGCQGSCCVLHAVCASEPGTTSRPGAEQRGVPVARVQKTTIRTCAVNSEEENEVFILTYGGRKQLVLSTFTVVFRP